LQLSPFPPEAFTRCGDGYQKVTTIKVANAAFFISWRVAMAGKVRGVAQAKANLDALIADVQGRKVVRAIQSAMLIGSTQASLYTPIDTSTLLNSQFRELNANGTRVTGRVGYSANYAVYVHDPAVQQTFRRFSPKASKTPESRLMPQCDRSCNYDALDV